jgi:anti-sigma B factor antagonist
MSGQLYFWLSDGTAWARVIGAGSHHNSTHLKEFARNASNVGIRDYAVDLAECTEVDSTFMGTCAFIALRCRELNGAVRLLNCSAENLLQFENLGLDQLFQINPPSP